MNTKNALPRLQSLDAFRGITIAFMILVNSPGKQVAYSCLEHSSWNGCTLADLVFPFFIVIVGISCVLSLTNLRTRGVPDGQLFRLIIKRSLYLFGIGLLLNALPNHFDFSHIRVLGVLQRIAICYFCSATLFLITKMRVQLVIIAILLIGYWFLIIGYPPVSSASINLNLVGYFDQLILSPQHLYTPLFDPEGLLSTLPAIASALFGNMIGVILLSSRTQKQQLYSIIASGLVLAALGLACSASFPLNKSLWSSSYVLWTSGLCYLLFATCFALIEINHLLQWTKPFLIFGNNALLVYFLHVLLLKIQAIILIQQANGPLINLRLYITDLLFSNFSPKNASLYYAIGYTLFWLFILNSLAEWRSAIRKINLT